VATTAESGGVKQMDAAQLQESTKHLLEESLIEGQDVVSRKGLTSDVESDAMNWETAVSGIRTMERKLKELHKTDHV